MHKTQRTQTGYRELISLALFFFVFLTSTFIFDEHAALLFGPSLVSPLESLMLGSSVIGFILRPYLCYRLPTRRHDVSTLMGTLAVAAIVVTIMARRTWVFLAGGIVLFKGVLGGDFHCFIGERQGAYKGDAPAHERELRPCRATLGGGQVVLLGIDGSVFAANGYGPVVATAHHHALEQRLAAHVRLARTILGKRAGKIALRFRHVTHA